LTTCCSAQTLDTTAAPVAPSRTATPEEANWPAKEAAVGGDLEQQQPVDS
jgi:hypothetical protein